MPDNPDAPREGEYKLGDDVARLRIDHPEYHHAWNEDGVYYQQFINAAEYQNHQAEVESVILKWDPEEREWETYKTTTIDGR